MLQQSYVKFFSCVFVKPLGNVIGAFDLVIHNGNVEKSRQRRSRHFAVSTYSMYAPRVKTAAALLDGLF